MPQELTCRQWRALATVYHLYTARDGADETTAAAAAAAVGISGHAEQKAGKEAVQWVEGVLPLLQRAFPPEVVAELRQRTRRRDADSSHHCNGRNRKRVEQWRKLIPEEMDALLSALLLLPPAENDASSSFLSLTSSEHALLRLLNKEQRWADRCYQQNATLKEQMRRVGESLLSLAAGESSGVADGCNAACGVAMVKPPREERVAVEKVTGAAGNSHDGQKKLAVAVLDDEEAAGTESSETPDASLEYVGAQPPPLTTTTTTAAAAEAAMAAAVDLTCAGCGEGGGELFQCRHCHLLRHEACGGPKVGSDTGFCDVCCHELGLSVSSQSLRSSTSTEERAELGDDDDDDDSSLSGFIVNTSDASESAEEPSSSSSSSSSSSTVERRGLLPTKRRRRS